MDIKNITPLYKFYWFRHLLNGYIELLDSNKNLSKNKSEKLVILFIWSIELIFYKNGIGVYYPDWRISPETGFVYKHKIYSIRYKIIMKLFEVFTKSKLSLFLSNIILKIDLFSLLNDRYKLRLDSLKLYIVSNILPDYSKNSYNLRNKFFDSYQFLFDDPRLFNNIKYLLSPHFFEQKNLIDYFTINVNSEKFIFPKMIKILSLTSDMYIKHYSHGAVEGWYHDNCSDKKIQFFSDDMKLWNISDKSSIIRYYIPPKKRQSVAKVLWITRPELNRFYLDTVTNLDHRNFKSDLIKHFIDIHKILFPYSYCFVLHKKGILEEYQTILRSAPNKIKFNPKHVNNNDLLIFDTVNSSLIFYAVKYSIPFLIYDPFIPENTTSEYKKFIQFLLNSNKLFNDPKKFSSKLLLTL